jgi:hypothetical protein
MGERLYFERFLWFDAEIRRGRFPNATHLAEQFECSVKTAQRTIEFFRDRMPLWSTNRPAGDTTMPTRDSGYRSPA